MVLRYTTVFVGVMIAYKYKMILLKRAKKSIWYSIIVIGLVCLMHYGFCLKYDCFARKEIYKLFLAVYLVIVYEVFDFFFYKEIIEEEEKNNN